MSHHTDEPRPIDEAAQQSYSWLGKGYVFVSKTKITTWKSVLVLAFLTGIAVASIMLVSADLGLNVSAASALDKQCTVSPDGGVFREKTKVVINCGDRVKSATYQWSGGSAEEIARTKIGKEKIMRKETFYNAQNDQVLTVVATINRKEKNVSTYEFKAQKIGSYSVDIDNDISPLNRDRNVLAGQKILLGRLKFTSENEAAIIEDLVLQNIGSAKDDTLKQVYLFDNQDLVGVPVASADMTGVQAKIMFEDMNFTVPTESITYLYVGANIGAVDYSSDPGADATASAGTNVSLRVPENDEFYVTKVVGVDSGELLEFPGPSNVSKRVNVYGAVMSNISTNFSDSSLVSGVRKRIFTFNVTAPNSSNVDYDGSPLGFKLDSVNFSIASSRVQLSNYQIERLGGSEGRVAVLGSTTPGSVLVDFANAYQDSPDLLVYPGDTAEYVLYADAIGVSEGSFVQLSIENVDESVLYAHNTASSPGVDGLNTALITPLLGISNVQGGMLMN